VTDDSDVLAYEKWKGLKNEQIFIVNNENSDKEPAVVHNFKVTTEQAPIHDILSFSSKNDHTGGKRIHNTSSLLFQILDYVVKYRQIISLMIISN